MDNHHGDIKKLPQRIEILTSKGELSDVRGTIKYSGLVDGTEGDWFGIEWDDISRGKHSGEKEGKQYFETIFPNSATFVRPSKKIYTGQSFLKAFRSRYGYSDSALEFAPNIDRITKKLSQTDQLKIASVDHMGVYGVDDLEKENTKQEAKSIRQLSVAHSLISDMEDVDKLVACLPNLQDLDLRIRITNDDYSHICQLKSMKLNNTLIKYQQITQMHHSLSSLEELELAYNNITSLPASYTLGNLQILSLAHNNINEWNEIEGILINLPNLQTLKLNHNKIGRISYPTSNTANSRLKTLILSHNGIDNWKSIDALSLRFTQLESLSLTDCPLMSTQCDVGILRQSVIARFEKLETLNLSEVDERKDAEYFYIRNPPTEEDPKRARYHSLCQKYDYQPSVQPAKKLTHLQLKKLSIDIRMDSKTYPLTTISSITIKKLRLIIKRLFDLPSSDFKLIASMIPPPNMFGVVDEERTEVVLDDDYKDLRCNYEDIRMSTNSPPPFFNALFAGALSGVTVDLFFFPVDTLKTRLQSTQGFLQAGGFKNIYKGVGSVAFGGAPGAAAFFTTYEGLKKAIPQISSLSTIPDAAVHMLAGSGGETAACLIRVPTEVVKSRQQTMAYGSVSSLKAAQLLLSQEGLNGFYRGFGITVFREIPFTSIQFPLYEYLKSRVAKYRNRDHARPYEGALCGTIAGAVAAATTTPLDVIKTRTMLSKELAMEHLQDVVQPKSDHSAKDWAFQQDNQLRMAAALNHGTYGDSSGIMTRHRAAMAARNLQSPNSLSNGLASAPLPSSINSPLSSMYTLQTPLPIGRLPLTPTTASSSCVTRSTSPTNSVASTSQTSFSFQQQQNNSATATPSPKDSPSSNWISNQIPGIHSLMAPSPSGSSTTSNSSSIGPRRKTKLINETRRAICVFAEENPSARQEDIASRYQIERSTVSKILKQKDKWKSIIPGGASSRVAKHRPSKFPDIESRLSAWAQECALSNHYLTDHAIREKAKTVARSLGYPEEKFKASSGWVEKFKERNNIKKGKVNGVLQSSGATPVGSLTPSESDSTTDYIGQVNPLATPNHSFTYTQQHQQQSRQIPSVGPRHEPPFVQAHQDYGLSDHHANNHLLALASAAVAVDDLNHEKYTVEQERLGHEMAWIMELKRKLEQQQPIIELIKSDAIQITRFYEQGSLTETAFKQAVEMLCPFVGIDLTYGIYDIRTYLIDRMNLILARLG
ncbi:L domain-like protein [Wallemia mellicola]|nr:L domain-like protein [Wallemia mellicola]